MPETEGSRTAVSRLLDQQDGINKTLGDMRERLSSIEAQLKHMCGQRAEQHDDHMNCRRDIDKKIEALIEEDKRLDQRVQTLVAWGKALAITGTIVVVILTVLNFVARWG